MAKSIDRAIVSCAMALISVVLTLALIGFFSWQDDRALAETQLYQDIPLDETLLHLDRRALEEAYTAQLMKLFSVWMSSQAPTDARALQNGLRLARRGYTQAAAQIAKREEELRQRQ